MTSSRTLSLDELVVQISRRNPMQQRALLEACANLTEEEAGELDRYLEFCQSDGVGIDELASAYQTITMDTLREQVFFQRNGRYRHSTFKEVADKVYFDPGYMSQYMHGLAVTLFLWPNHLKIVRFFRDSLPRDRSGQYLEVGPGHGIFFRHAVRFGGFESCLGIDISPTSLELTRKLLLSDPASSKASWELLQADFLAASALDRQFDSIVMGEVLEHVEDPLQFLVRIRSLAHESSFIFVTTAVNAPAVDHIYLFRTVEEVTDLASAAGLKVKDVLATPYLGCTMDETVRQKLPINVALVLER